MGIRSNLHSVHLVLLCPKKCCWYWEAIFKYPLCHCCSIYGISLDCRFLLRVTLIQRQSHSLVLAGRCLRMSLAQPPAESWIDTKVRPSCLQLFPLGCCGGLTLARDKLPHSCSLTSQQDTMGEKKPKPKSRNLVDWDKDREITYLLLSWEKKTQTKIINLLHVKVNLDYEKRTETAPSLHTFPSPAFTSSFPAPEERNGNGVEVSPSQPLLAPFTPHVSLLGACWVG